MAIPVNEDILLTLGEGDNLLALTANAATNQPELAPMSASDEQIWQIIPGSEEDSYVLKNGSKYFSKQASGNSSVMAADGFNLQLTYNSTARQLKIFTSTKNVTCSLQIGNVPVFQAKDSANASIWTVKFPPNNSSNS